MKSDHLNTEFAAAMAALNDSAAMRRLWSGGVKVPEYAQYLRQVVHYTAVNPQLQALAGANLGRAKRKLVGTYLKHALSEVGHDQLAVRDLRKLDVDVEFMKTDEPLLETTLLTALPRHQLANYGPVGHLGYLYFLEFLPTASGAAYADLLLEGGVPETAMSFIREHVRVDVAHNALMPVYADCLIDTEQDLAVVTTSIRQTGILYASMLNAAFARADYLRDPDVDAGEERRAFRSTLTA
jgi:hypothetical protein